MSLSSRYAPSSDSRSAVVVNSQVASPSPIWSAPVHAIGYAIVLVVWGYHLAKIVGRRWPSKDRSAPA